MHIKLLRSTPVPLPYLMIEHPERASSPSARNGHNTGGLDVFAYVMRGSVRVPFLTLSPYLDMTTSI